MEITGLNFQRKVRERVYNTPSWLVLSGVVPNIIALKPGSLDRIYSYGLCFGVN